MPFLVKTANSKAHFTREQYIVVALYCVRRINKIILDYAERDIENPNRYYLDHYKMHTLTYHFYMRCAVICEEEKTFVHRTLLREMAMDMMRIMENMLYSHEDAPYWDDCPIFDFNVSLELKIFLTAYLIDQRKA